ncbi:hypothetical protein JCM10369A_32690 [Nocardioides pyridinolyticus]
MELAYDASPDEVYAMLTDPAFREGACHRMKVLRATAAVAESGDATVVTIDQVQPAKGLPSFATKLVGDEIQIVQEETWTGGRQADVHVSIPGKPGEMVGSAVLEETAGGTVEKVDLEIRVRIPLVAGKIEKLVAHMLRKALEAENEAGRDYLSR